MLLLTIKSNWSILNCRQNLYWDFVIISHTYHRCMYIFLIIDTTVVVFFLKFTITPFTETDMLLLFLFIFRWLRTFFKLAIFRSASKTVARCTFSLLFVWITIHTRCFLILSYPFEKDILQKGWQLHKKFILSGQDLLSHYFYQNLNCCQDLNSQSV